ncbi:MAG: glycoside hydrolase family 13 protein [Lachnospiraceae bacterium]|nr:glycoside hydrolase family 13 protein [Lachnospiraceae bacterium]
MDRLALFSDGTENYRSPSEPECNSTVQVYMRTLADDVDEIHVLTDGNRIPMVIDRMVDGYDYYVADLCVKESRVNYLFEIKREQEVLYYQEGGITEYPAYERAFYLIPGFSVPKWSRGAVMYQIFVDRFYNGDKTNDVQTREYYYNYAHSDKVEGWNRYPSPSHVGEFYGGDLQGVIEKLPYLEELGVEAIYFNPLFVSPSYHKYDTQDYDYIDPHFGVIKVAEGELLSELETDNRKSRRYISKVTKKENLEASNALFCKLVEEAHKKNIKVIIDGVFNHCGSFHKWLDREGIYAGQEGYEAGAYQDKESPYHDYFKFNNPNGWPNNSSYDGWWGFDTLPKLNYEASKGLEDEIMRIAAKWVSEPFNADGWRLDVASDLGQNEEYNHKFWKRFRKVVKEANPQAIIIAEHYGDPSSWLMGDEWDTIMNYDAFMEPISYYLTGMEKHSDEFCPDLLNNLDYFKGTMLNQMSNFLTPSLQCSMNQLSNHDHSRFLTRTNHKVGRVNQLGPTAASTGIDHRVMIEAMVIQMTWPGAPTLYYGDEAGVCGFTDPDNRRTYPWGEENRKLLDAYKKAIRLHKEHEVLKTGSFRFISGSSGMLKYARFNREEQMIILVNNGEDTISDMIRVTEAGIPFDCTLNQVLYAYDGFISTVSVAYEVKEGYLDLLIPSKSVVVLSHTKNNKKD